MRKPVLLLSLITIIGVGIGYLGGSFLTRRATLKAISNMPAAPIVVQSVYDTEQHAILVSVLNPGLKPITAVSYSLVFTPGTQTTQAAYMLAPMPLNVVLPPQAVTVLTLNLKEQTPHLQVGDVVTGTITYGYEGIPEIYQLIHTFTKGTGAESVTTEQEQESQQAPAESTATDTTAS